MDVTAISFALAGRNLAGILGPVFAPVADLRGRKFVMLTGIVCFTVGVGLVAVHPGLLTFSAALILAILSKSLFDPAVQAYFGDRVPYEQRGSAIAVTEMAWSLVVHRRSAGRRLPDRTLRLVRALPRTGSTGHRDVRSSSGE